MEEFSKDSVYENNNKYDGENTTTLTERNNKENVTTGDNNTTNSNNNPDNNNQNKDNKQNQNQEEKNKEENERYGSEEQFGSEQSFESESEAGRKRSRRTAAINQRLLMKKITSHEEVVEQTEPEVQKPKRKKEYKKSQSVSERDIDTFNTLFGNTMGMNPGLLLAPNLQNPEPFGYSQNANLKQGILLNPGFKTGNLANPGFDNLNLPNAGNLPYSAVNNPNVPSPTNLQLPFNLHSQNAPNPYYYSTSSDPGHAYSSSYSPSVKHEDVYKVPMAQRMVYNPGQGSEKDYSNSNTDNYNQDNKQNQNQEEKLIVNMMEKMRRMSKADGTETLGKAESKYQDNYKTTSNADNYNQNKNNQKQNQQNKQTKLEQYSYQESNSNTDSDYLENETGERVTTDQLKNPGVIYNFNEIDNIFLKKKKKVLVNMDHLFVKGLKYIKEYMENNLKSFTGDLMGLRGMGLDNFVIDPEYFLQTGGDYSQLKDEVEVANRFIESLQAELDELHARMGKTQLTKINEPPVQCCSTTYSIANKDSKDKPLEYEEILEEMRDFQDLVNDEHREKRKLFKNLISGTSRYIHKMEMELNKSKSEKNKHILVLYKNISNMIDLFWKKIEKFAWEHLKKDLQQELMKKKKENLDKFIQDAIKVSINDQDRYIFNKKMKSTSNKNKEKEEDKDNSEKENEEEKDNKDNKEKDEEKEVALDEDDYEITLGEEDEKMEKEDLKLEEEMESDKEEGELDALQKDLEMPIEELLKMYQVDRGEEEEEEMEESEEEEVDSSKENKDNKQKQKQKQEKEEKQKSETKEKEFLDNLDSESSLLSDKDGEGRVKVRSKRSREKYKSSPDNNNKEMERKKEETKEKDEEKEVALDEDDYEITLGEEDEKMEKEDLKLEEEMESDKEEGELDALQKDLEMPIEELLKMYQVDRGEEEEEEMEESEDEDNDEQEKAETKEHERNGLITNKRQMLTNREVVKETEDDESEEEEGEQENKNIIGKVKTPFLIRGVLRPYQKEGLGWLVSLYQRGINGVLADEMGLGKTLQAISLLAHLACVEGNWGPHIIVVPTSILLNWVMEFNKFCPGFKLLAYYGSQAERARKRTGWNRPHSFNVLITSYSTAVQDAYVLKRRVWEYMILDEAQNIKNFHSKRWQTLLTFNTKYRLLLTGTPLQNSLQELWSLMHFILPNIFTSHTQFNIWFTDPLNQALDNMYSSNPLYKDYKDSANGNADNKNEEMNRTNMELVEKLHVIFRPYLLRRLKKDVEKQMPSKYEHVLKCTLTRRQQVLYDEYISLYNLSSGKGGPKEALSYKSMLNILMQLRKICNHPNQLRSRDVEIPVEFNISTVQLPSFFNVTSCGSRADFSNYTKLNLFNRIQSMQNTNSNADNNNQNNNDQKNKRKENKQVKQEEFERYGSEEMKEEKELVSSYFTRNQQGSRSGAGRYGQYSDRGDYYYGYRYSEQNKENKYEKKDRKRDHTTSNTDNNNQDNEEEENYKSTFQFPRKYKDRLVLDSRVKKRKLNTSFGVQFLLETTEEMENEDNYNTTSNADNYNNEKEEVKGKKQKSETKEEENERYGSVEDKLMLEKAVCEQLLKRENSMLNLNLGNKLEVNKVIEGYLSLVLNFLFISDKVVSRPVRLYYSGESGVNFNNRQDWHMKEVTSKLLKRDDKEYFKKNSVTVEAVNSHYRLLFPSKRALNDDCGKFRVLGPLLLKLRSEGHRCIVYTQFSKMLDILENWINFMGFTYTRLDGSTKVELRQKIINRFNENTKIFLFISSTRTGGVGITLTGADTVVFYDTDWNPAIDRQAMDRCHRIGQTKDVNVYRLISEHTVEENIWRKQLQKRKLDDLIVDQGQFDIQRNNWFSNIDTLINIFQHKSDEEDDEEIYGRKILHESAVDETQVKTTGVQSLKMLIEVEDVDDSMALKKLTKENEKINKQDFENDIINSIPGLVSYCIKFLLKYQTVTLVKQVESMKLKIHIEDYQKSQKEEEEEDEDDIYTDYTSSEGGMDEDEEEEESE